MEDQETIRRRADLQARLQSPDLAVRRAAAEEFLKKNGQAFRGLAPLAFLMLLDPDEQVREAIVGWFEDCGRPNPEEAAQMISFLFSPTDDVVYWAITLLGRFGPDAKRGVGPLIMNLGESKAIAIREKAAWALGRIGPAAAEARSAL